MKKINYQWLLITACFVTGIGTIQPTMAESFRRHQEQSNNEISGDVVEVPNDEERVVQWENTHVLIRFLVGNIDENLDPLGLYYNRIPTDQGRLLMLLGIFTTPEIIATPVTGESINWFDSVRLHLDSQKANGEITKSERIIYYGLLPDANPEELHDAGEELSKLGEEYKVYAKDIYLKSANHILARADDIILAAEGLTELGDQYYSDAVTLFVRAANRPKVTPEEILEILEGMIVCEGVDASTDFTLRESIYKAEWTKIANKLLNHRLCDDRYKESAQDFLRKLGQ